MPLREYDNLMSLMKFSALSTQSKKHVKYASCLVYVVHYIAQGYYFGCGSVWARNLVSDIKGGNRLRASENRVLRRIFGRKRNELTGGWRKLHNEELRNFYSSPSITRTNKLWRMGRECSTIWSDVECI
jgi:hypothetical protein